MRWSFRLQWLFAALFLLCGLPLMFLDTGDPEPAIVRPLAGAATFSLGAFALCLAWNAWVTGALTLQHINYTRNGAPRRFAAVLILILLAGVGTVITAFWFWLFR